MVEHRSIGPDEDPVCGMLVDLDGARARNLIRAFEGREYGFCGKGCYLEFGDDPESFLAAGYTPQM